MQYAREPVGQTAANMRRCARLRAARGKRCLRRAPVQADGDESSAVREEAKNRCQMHKRGKKMRLHGR